MHNARTWSRQVAATLLAAGLAVFSSGAAAQGATPAVTTLPVNPSDSDDVVLVIRGNFPSTDYSITGSEISRYDVPAASAHGANEVEFAVTLRYRFGPVGGQAMTPYEARFPVGRFPRFTRIRVSINILPQQLPGSAWFSGTPYLAYAYVRNPEPARLEVTPPSPTTADDIRVTMRFYHSRYHIARTTTQIDGNVIHLFQDVSYVGPDDSEAQVSEAVVTHDLGSLPAGQYTLQWSVFNGLPEPQVTLIPLTVLAGGVCPSCVTPERHLGLERTRIDYDAIPFGEYAGSQTITINPLVQPSGISPPPPSWIALRRIWTDNQDYVLSHDCPMEPALLNPGQSCTLTVDFNPSLRGDEPGRIFVRFVDYVASNGEYTTTINVGGKSILPRGINFIPLPITPDTAVEYYAPSLQHYFFTTSQADKDLLDAGFYGAWQRTGIAFPIGGPTDVCRFYGDHGRPNSHFYTGIAAECEALRAMDAATPLGTPAWRFEGLVMKAEVPALPAFSVMSRRAACVLENSRNPIYRLYNDGFAHGVDSNHRYVPSRGNVPAGKTGEDIVREMMRDGWIYEKNAFCN